MARLAVHLVDPVFGPSGTGKTSLLLAGVLPRLASRAMATSTCDALDDPLPAVCKEVATPCGTDLRPAVASTLRAFLRSNLAPNDKLVVVLDQFEELFLRVGTGAAALLAVSPPSASWRRR